MKIYFKYKNILRDFYFVSLGKDGSVYFGSSASKNFTRGCHSSAYVPNEGLHIDYGQNIKPLSVFEKKSKLSFHKSGVFVCESDKNGKRDRYKLIPPAELDGPIPLVGILPMRIDKYPASRNRVKQEDMVLDFPKEVYPFGMVIYLKRASVDEPRLFLAEENWSFGKLVSKELGKRFLGVFIYVPKKPFSAWQQLQIDIVARSKGEQKVPLWPILEN